MDTFHLFGDETGGGGGGDGAEGREGGGGEDNEREEGGAGQSVAKLKTLDGEAFCSCLEMCFEHMVREGRERRGGRRGVEKREGRDGVGRGGEGRAEREEGGEEEKEGGEGAKEAGKKGGVLLSARGVGIDIGTAGLENAIAVLWVGEILRLVVKSLITSHPIPPHPISPPTRPLPPSSWHLLML